MKHNSFISTGVIRQEVHTDMEDKKHEEDWLHICESYERLTDKTEVNMMQCKMFGDAAEGVYFTIQEYGSRRKCL